MESVSVYKNQMQLLVKHQSTRRHLSTRTSHYNSLQVQEKSNSKLFKMRSINVLACLIVALLAVQSEGYTFLVPASKK